MTLGEKIREARQACGFSQEEFAEKMSVSRSAVAKWETDKGVPDIDNLKALAALLNVSIDFLLDGESSLDNGMIRESYNISEYGKGSKKKKKDRVIREKFPNAEIHTLIGKLKLKKSEKVIDNVLGFFTDAPFGIPDLLNSFKNMDKEFYLVNDGGNQYLVTVTDEFVETQRLPLHITDEKFEIGNWKFMKCKYEVRDDKKEERTKK